MTPDKLRQKFMAQLSAIGVPNLDFPELPKGPFKVVLPELPTVPKPLLPKYSSFRQEIDKFIQEFMSQWQLIIPVEILKLLSSLFPFQMPEIPCIGMPLDEIFEKGGVTKAIELAKAKGGIAKCLGLPDPLLPNFTFPDFDILNQIQIAFANMLATLINMVMEKGR